MTLKQIRIGSLIDVFQYDDGDFIGAIETDQPIKAGAPVDTNDVIRKADLGTYVTGPAGAVADNLVSFNGNTGYIVKDSGLSTADVSDAVSASHSNALDHTQGTDTALGTQLEALDMGGFKVTNSTTPTDPNDLTTKEYVDLAVVSLEITEFFANIASDIGGIYYVMNDIEAAASTVTSAAVTGADQNIFNFATLANHPGLNRLLAAVYDCHAHLSINSAGANITVYYKIFKRVGAVETLLATSEASTVLSAIVTAYQLHSVIATEEALNVTDRIVIKWYATLVSGANTKTVIMTVGGTADSHFSMQVQSSELKSILVPYTGAMEDVDLGNYYLTSGGVTSWNYAAAIADDGTKALPTILANYAALVDVIISSVGVVDTYATFIIDSIGTVTPRGYSVDCVFNEDTDLKLCIGTAVSQNPLIIKYRLGSAAAKIMITMKYVKA